MHFSMIDVQARNADGSLQEAGLFDAFAMPTSTVHRGPAHSGFRALFFVVWFPMHTTVPPVVQVSAATVIHHFCDIANNILGDRMLLEYAEFKPWLHFKDLPMWEQLCVSLPRMREEDYNDPNKPNYVPESLMAELMEALEWIRV